MYATIPPKKRSHEVFYSKIPPLSHFVDADALTLFCTVLVEKRIVFERSFAFDTLHPKVKEFVEDL